MKTLIPYSAEERTIQLPLGIDFTKPGQVDPWRSKEFRERGGFASCQLAQFGGLAQQQQNAQFN